jgi:hypothetical protein
MGVTTISLVCSGFVLLASDPDHRRSIDNVSLTIDPRGGRVSGVSKGTIEESRASEQIGWVDHEGARWIRSRSYRWLKC